MNQTHYAFRYAEQENIFRFTSVGRHGRIEKVVQFLLFADGVYNLGFGDLDLATGIIDDKVVTDNGDMPTVLATIIAIVDRFFNQKPGAKIFLTGSSRSRTRLYQIIINVYFKDLSAVYKIFGFRDNDWWDFEKNATYESFLVMKLL